MTTMKQKFLNTFILFIGATLLSSCKSTCDCETINRKVKDGEILYKICRYIVDNNVVTNPADPCTFEIREMQSDTLNGKEILRVKLSCCYMGDQAIIDKKTNAVIGYIASDK